MLKEKKNEKTKNHIKAQNSLWSLKVKAFINKYQPVCKITFHFSVATSRFVKLPAGMSFVEIHIILLSLCLQSVVELQYLRSDFQYLQLWCFRCFYSVFVAIVMIWWEDFLCWCNLCISLCIFLLLCIWLRFSFVKEIVRGCL